MLRLLTPIKSCFVLLSLLFASASWAEPRLIVSTKSDVERLSVSSARAIFSMRVNQWPDGSPVVVYVLPDNTPDHKAFTRKVLSMLPHQLRRSWDRYQYSGTGVPPIQVSSVEEMLEKVTSTPGAIGYVDERSIDEGVRVLSVR